MNVSMTLCKHKLLTGLYSITDIIHIILLSRPIDFHLHCIIISFRCNVIFLLFYNIIINKWRNGSKINVFHTNNNNY